MKANHPARKALSMLLVIMMIITAVPFAFAAKVEAADTPVTADGRAVLYVASTGTTSGGASAAAPYFGKADAILQKLQDMIDADPSLDRHEAVVVICGNLNNHYASGASTFLYTRPSNMEDDFKIVYTSLFNDGTTTTDYRATNDARWGLALGTSASIFCFNWNAEFDYVRFNKVTNGNQFLVANYHDFILKPTCTFTYAFGTVSTSTATSTDADDAPIFYGGYADPSVNRTITGLTQNIELGAGTWFYAKGGDRVQNTTTKGRTLLKDSTVNMKFSGASFNYAVSGTSYVMQATSPLGHNLYDNVTVNVDVTAGNFAGYFAAYGSGYFGMTFYNNPGSLALTKFDGYDSFIQNCAINVNIEGGNFANGLRGVQIFDSTCNSSSYTYYDPYTVQGTLNVTATGGTSARNAALGTYIDGRYNTENLPDYDAVYGVNPYDPYPIEHSNFHTESYDTADTDVHTFAYPAAVNFADLGAMTYSTYNATEDISAATYITHNDTAHTFKLPLCVTDTDAVVKFVRLDGGTRYTYTHIIDGAALASTTALNNWTTETVDLSASEFIFPAGVTSLSNVYAIYNSASAFGADYNLKDIAESIDGGFSLAIPATTTAATITLVTVSGNAKTAYTYNVTGDGTTLDSIPAPSAGVTTTFAGTSRVDGDGNVRAVLYVGNTGNNTNGGTSPSDLFYDTPEAIVEKLDTMVGNGGTSATEAVVVVCAPIDNAFNHGTNMPVSLDPGFKVIYTSYYMDTDYRSDTAGVGGEWQLAVTGSSSTQFIFYFGWDAEFDYINFRKVMTNVQYIIARYHDFIIHTNCDMSFDAGVPTVGTQAPIFYGGNSKINDEFTFSGTQNIELGAGTWYYAKAGERMDTSANAYKVGVITGTVNFTISGGEYLGIISGMAVNSQQSVSPIGHGIYDGATVNFTVTGGTFDKYVSLIGSAYGGLSGYATRKVTGYDSFIQDCDLTVNISGGTFTEGIRGVQIYETGLSSPDYYNTVTGSLTVNITGGVFPAGTAVTGNYTEADSARNLFATSIYVDDPYRVMTAGFESASFGTATTETVTFNYPVATANWVDFDTIKYSTYSADANIYGAAFVTHDDTAKTFTLPIKTTDTASAVSIETALVNCVKTDYTYNITGIPAGALSYATSEVTSMHNYVFVTEHNGTDGKTADFLGSRCTSCGDVEYEFIIDENGPVVFYKAYKNASDAGNGTTPAQAKALIGDCLNLIATFGKGGTVVVVGPSTPGNITSPAGIGGTVIITSVYGGHDYRFGSTTKTNGADDANGAYFSFYGGTNNFYCDIALKDVDLMATAYVKYIAMNGNDFTAHNVRTGNFTADANGVVTNFTEGDAPATLTAPKYALVLGSYLTSALTWNSKPGANQTVDIDSGRWFCIIAGNHRTAITDLTGSEIGGITANVTINISGGYFNNTGSTEAALKYDVITLTKGMETTADYKATVNISGGDFSDITTMYAKGRTSTIGSAISATNNDTTRGTLTYNIFGGTFNPTSGLTIKAYPSAETANTTAPNDKIIVNVYNATAKVTVDGSDKGESGAVVMNNAAGNTNLTATGAVSATVTLGNEGFAIRYDNNDATKNGIRFSTNMPIAEREKSFIDSSDYEIVEYGILAKAAANETALEWYVGASAPANHGKVAKSVSYSAYGNANDTNIFRKYKKDGDNNIGYIFSSVLVGIDNAHVTTDFVFRSYAVYNVGSEEEPVYVVAYGDAEYTKSIAEVASEIANTPTYTTDYTAEAQAYINGLAAMYIAP